MNESRGSPPSAFLRIVDILPGDKDLVEQAAVLLTEGFKTIAPGSWDTIESARQEMAECLEDGRLCLGAVDKDGLLLGWVGGRYSYGCVWELHPLVVSLPYQGHGIGRELVLALEARVAAQGGLTLTLGTDDHTAQTSLGGVELYPDVWRYVQEIQNLRRHPYEFYQKLGYIIIGVMPDANGWGKPDILMAKRVGPVEAAGQVKVE